MDLTQFGYHQTTIIRTKQTELKPIEGAIVNLTNRDIDARILTLLSYGPKFCPPRDATIKDVVDMMYKTHCNLCREYSPVVADYELSEMYKDMQINFEKCLGASEDKKRCHVNHLLLEAIKLTAEFFRNNEDIVITQADKGNRTVIIHMDEYEEKMEKFIKNGIDRGIYRKIENFDKTKKGVIAAYNNIKTKLLNEYKNAIPAYRPFSRHMRQDLKIRNNFTLPKLYGTIKCHKENAPVRPIRASHKWYSHEIQGIINKTLSENLKDRLCNNNVKNADDVVRILYKIPIAEGYVFVKFDIQDMYTSMDRTAIFDFLKSVIHHEEFRKKCKIDPILLQQLIYFSLETSNYVQYKDSIYFQTGGLPQGACDSGLYATIYLDYLLQVFNDSLFEMNHVVFWFKYMDDFLLYIPKDKIESFRKEFETVTKLNLDVEEETKIDDCYNISFLNLNIYRYKNRIETASYKKPCASLRTINFFSNTPKVVKVNTIDQFIQCIFNKTCNNRLVSDLDDLIYKLGVNSYPSIFIRKIFVRKISKHIQAIQKKASNIPLNKEGRSQRIKILKTYSNKFNIKIKHPQPYRIDRNNGENKKQRIVYDAYCIPFAKIIAKIHKLHKLANPVFKQKRINLQEHTPQARIEARKEEDRYDEKRNMGITKCTDCDEYFIIYGEKELNKLLQININRQNSEIDKHMTTYNHRPPTDIYKINNQSGMTVSAQVKIYEALMKTRGISCHTTGTLLNMPKYIRMIIHREGEKGNKKLGLPLGKISRSGETDENTLL